MSRKRFFHPLIMWKRNQKKVRFFCQGRVGLSMVNNSTPVKTQIVCQSFSFCAWSQSRVHCSRMLPSIAKKMSLYSLMNGELSSRSVIHPELTSWRQVELVLPLSTFLGWFHSSPVKTQIVRQSFSFCAWSQSRVHCSRMLPSLAKKTSLYSLMNGELSSRSVIHPEFYNCK